MPGRGLAYHPEAHHLVIAESKVQGPKRIVYAFTAETKADFIKFDDGKYLAFLRHIELLCSDGIVFEDFRKMVRRLTIQLVSNYYISPDVHADAQRAVEARIVGHVPKCIKLDVQLDTTLDVVLRILRAEKAESQGRRYGHAVLDLARELNRYMDPQVLYAGRSSGSSERGRSALARKIAESFCEQHPSRMTSKSSTPLGAAIYRV